MIRVCILILLYSASLAHAQASATAEELNRLNTEIGKLMGNPATHAQGVQQIDKLMDLDRNRAASGLRNSWLRSLTGSRRFADVERLARQAVLAAANDAGAIEQMQAMRARALLAMGEPVRALSAAKSTFNVCPLSASSSAMLLVAECLNAAYPVTAPTTSPTTQSATQPVSVVEQFRREQMAGVTHEGARPLTDKGKRSAVLDRVKVDAGEYEEEIARLTGEDYATLHARGNLLLLADRPAEAMSVFERAYSQASDGQLQQASEAIARCIRAQDGTIGRANAWVATIRPKKP